MNYLNSIKRRCKLEIAVRLIKAGVKPKIIKESTGLSLIKIDALIKASNMASKEKTEIICR